MPKPAQSCVSRHAVAHQPFAQAFNAPDQGGTAHGHQADLASLWEIKPKAQHQCWDGKNTATCACQAERHTDACAQRR